jgi:hypothetical protein
MALPVTIPNTFASATASIPLSQLDTNFTTLADAVNGISDGSETLANASVTVITAGTANVTTLNTSGQVVFNDAGADVDFRVEGDTDANLLFVDASADKVGIGTNAPDRKLVVLDSVDNNLPAAVITKTGLTGANSGLQVHTNEASASGGSFGFRVTSGSTYDAPTNEIIRVNQHGLCFNGDTTADDALDDYEEGATTVTLTPSTSGTITLNASYQTVAYTKVGRVVTITGELFVSSVSTPVGTSVSIGNLPFAAGSASNAFASGFGILNLGTGGVVGARISANTNTIDLRVDASTIGANYNIVVGFSYMT